MSAVTPVEYLLSGIQCYSSGVSTVWGACGGDLLSAAVGTNVDFKIRLDQLRDIRSRRYNMQRTAIELFLVDQTNYFLNFRSAKVRRGRETGRLWE